MTIGHLRGGPAASLHLPPPQAAREPQKSQ
jgi:hypothetical protein